MAFAAYGGGGAVAGVDGEIVGEFQEAPERFHHGEFVAAGQVISADGIAENKVAGKHEIVRFHDETDATGGVAGCVDDIELEVAGIEGLSLGKQVIVGVFLKRDIVPFGAAEKAAGEHGGVGTVDVDGRTGNAANLGVGADVIYVTVGIEDGFDGDFILLDKCADVIRIATGINDDAVPIIVVQYVAVGVHAADDDGFDCYVLVHNLLGDSEEKDELVNFSGRAGRWSHR